MINHDSNGNLGIGVDGGEAARILAVAEKRFHPLEQRLPTQVRQRRLEVHVVELPIGRDHGVRVGLHAEAVAVVHVADGEHRLAVGGRGLGEAAVRPPRGEPAALDWRYWRRHILAAFLLQQLRPQ